ncbi:2-keto-4-pentenoate hydratase [Bacillus piscicola]|uniref:2-keto-4-pentenoate hydratase n=1 Tax=Bacillus piscicola TaxID=1632684 RepID=UPI001F09152A|nr:fumarylacetoacetate hydrolase family protein [Bacillus piscicola]
MFEVEKMVEQLLSAEDNHQELIRFTKDNPDFSIEQGYDLQNMLIKKRLSQSHRIIGMKMGLTSLAKMQQMNVNSPIYGHLLDYMQLDPGVPLIHSELIHPKAEAEIACVLKKDLQGPDVTAAEAIRAIDYVVPAFEIIDSRYENFDFKLPDVVADNASSSRFVLGTKPIEPTEIDMRLVGMTFWINGELKASGAGAAVLGHPANSLAELANMLHERDQYLRKGDIILTGGLTAAVALEPGDTVEAKLGQNDNVCFQVV